MLVQAVMSLYESSRLDQGHQTNLGYGLVYIKGLCYHH